MNMIETYTASRTDEQIARIVADLVWRTEGYLNEVARVVEGFNEKIAKGHALTSFDTDALVEAVGRQRTVHQVHAAATQELPEGKDERDRLNHLLSILQGGTFWRLTPMVNWHLSDFLRLELIYGYGRLDRFALKGNTQFFQSRLQVEF